MRFFLFNQYAGNKGDRAVLFALSNLILNNWKEAEIVVATSDPELWKDYGFYHANNIKFISNAWSYPSQGIYWRIINRLKKYSFTILREGFLKNIDFSKFVVNPEFRKYIKSADVAISVGGHHFTTILSRDLVSDANFDSMAVLLAKKRLIAFSQSFGPFKFYNIRNQKLTSKILTQSILCPREARSISEIKNLIGDRQNIYPTFESVLSLTELLPFVPMHQRDDAIGVAIYCAQQRTPEKKAEYIDILVRFCKHAINKGYEIRFFPMELKHSAPDDRPFIQELIDHIGRHDKCMVYDRDMETLEHLKEVSKCKLFLGHKTHSTIFALSTGTPLIALAYHPKTIEFLSQFGLEDHAFDDKTVSHADLIEKFDGILPDLEKLGQFEYEKAGQFSRKIQRDFVDRVERICC